MKRYFVKIIVFGFIALMTFIPICLKIKTSQTEKIKNAVLLPNGSSVLAVGHSHIECSLDPIFFPGLINQAKSSEQPLYSIAKANLFIQHNPTIKTIILAWSYFGLDTPTKIIQETGYDPFSIYFPILIDSPLICELYRKDNTAYFFKNYIISKFGFPSKKLINDYFHNKNRLQIKLDFEGCFLNEYKAALDKDDLSKKVGNKNKDFPLSEIRNYIDPIAQKNLENFFSESQKKGIKVVIFNAPTHKDYNNSFHPRIIETMDNFATELCEKYNMTYIDFHTYPLPDSMFRDYNHINTEGAKIITPLLRDTLQKLGIIETIML